MIQNLQRRLLGFLGVATVVLGLVYISWPVGHIPPYDANLVRLAESDLQGYCAGQTLMKTGGAPDANMTADCRARLAGTRSNTPNLRVVLTSFCQAVVDSGWQGTLKDCLQIVADNQYWPTYDGTVTNQWNRARPDPATFAPLSAGAPQGASRTGAHAGSTRNYTPIR